MKATGLQKREQIVGWLKFMSFLLWLLISTLEHIFSLLQMKSSYKFSTSHLGEYSVFFHHQNNNWQENTITDSLHSKVTTYRNILWLLLSFPSVKLFFCLCGLTSCPIWRSRVFILIPISSNILTPWWRNNVSMTALFY